MAAENRSTRGPLRPWSWVTMALASIVGCAAGLTPGGAKVVEGELPNPAACKRLGTVGEPLRELQGTPHETNPTGRPWEYSPGFALVYFVMHGDKSPPQAAPRASTRAEHVEEANRTAALRGDHLWRGEAYRCGDEAEQRARLVAALRSVPTGIDPFRLGMETAAAAPACFIAGGTLEKAGRCTGGLPGTKTTEWIDRAGRIAAVRTVSSPPEPSRYLEVVAATRKQLWTTFGPSTESEAREPDACRQGHEADCVLQGRASFRDKWLWPDGHVLEFGSTIVDERATTETVYRAASGDTHPVDPIPLLALRPPPENATRPTGSYVIRDSRLGWEAGSRPCTTNVKIVWDGRGYLMEGRIDVVKGTRQVFCPGAHHAWVGRSTNMDGAIRDLQSDLADPLVFDVVAGEGYAYRTGKGWLTLADGRAVVLPPTP